MCGLMWISAVGAEPAAVALPSTLPSASGPPAWAHRATSANASLPRRTMTMIGNDAGQDLEGTLMAIIEQSPATIADSDARRETVSARSVAESGMSHP